MTLLSPLIHSILVLPYRVRSKFHYRESKSYGVHFIDTGATISKRHFRLNLLITLAKTVIPFVKFPESDDIQLKVSINSYIR